MLTTYTRPTLVEVVTPYCAECRAMKPDLDAVAAEFDDVDLVVLDASRDPQAASELRVVGTPTLIAVRNGSEVARFMGRRTRGELRVLFTEVAAGDPTRIARTSGSDRLVGTVAGVGLAGVGLLLGPAWLLFWIGVAVVAYMNLPHFCPRLRR